MIKVINVDWFEIYANLHQPMPTGKSGNFFFTTEDVHSRIYRKITKIDFVKKSDSGEILQPFCEIVHEPKSSILPPDACSLKVLNSNLYSENWQERMSILAKEQNIEYRNITRLDLACDVNKFTGNTNPESFMQKIASFEYQRLGKQNFTIHVGEGKEKVKSNYDGKEIIMEKPYVETITWGSIMSGRQLTIYDKSRELKTKSYKPWIIEVWKLAGLDINHVFRIELRLIKKGLRIEWMDDNKITSISLNDIKTQKKIEELFYGYFQEMGKFVETGTNTRKRRSKRVYLINKKQEFSFRPKFKNIPSVSTQTLKVVKNCLEQMAVLNDSRCLEVFDDQFRRSVRKVCEKIEEFMKPVMEFKQTIEKQSFFNPMLAIFAKRRKIKSMDIFEQSAIRSLFVTEKLELAELKQTYMRNYLTNQVFNKPSYD